MKIKGITFLIIAIIVLCGICLILPDGTKNEEYLRIHVRANSNEQKDQDIKLIVRDRVVAFLTPYIAECNTKEKAKTLLTDRLDQIKEVCDRVLVQNGYNYESKEKDEQEVQYSIEPVV